MIKKIIFIGALCFCLDSTLGCRPGAGGHNAEERVVNSESIYLGRVSGKRMPELESSDGRYEIEAKWCIGGYAELAEEVAVYYDAENDYWLVSSFSPYDMNVHDYVRSLYSGEK